MYPAFGLVSPREAVAGLSVLALLEATRLTGVARNVLEFARVAQLGSAGLQVAMAVALIRRCVRGGRVDALHGLAVAAGLPVDVLIERHRYDSQIIDELRRVVHARRPHIIETHHTKSHCLMALSGLWRHYTWVAFHHGYTQTDAKVRAYNQVDRYSLRHATHVVTTNHPFAELLVSRGVNRGRVTVLHNAVRELTALPDSARVLRRSLGIEDGEQVVLAVGRLSHEKGQAYLIRAAASWRDRARLVIVGDGPDRPALERLARMRGVDRLVIFAGMTSNVAPYYAMADVFVLPSLSEGSPNALLEAMAAGLPVVATRAGGVPEIAVDGSSALLVPIQDTARLASAVNRLLRDQVLARQLGAAARRTVLTRHTPEQRAGTLTQLYAALAGVESGRLATPAALAAVRCG